uniref:YidE/YbjL duplication n=1 Tax=Solibacter usitatus (strain Ellin6076) TaxID=234267 RepID=Q01VG0_SOLUE
MREEAALSWLAASLQNHPEIVLFMVIGVGHAVSRLRIGSFRLNSVVCVILAGVAVGQLGVTPPPPAVQWSFFTLFLFAVGFETGPQFFGGLGRGALPQIGLSLFFCAVGLASAYFLSRFFGFNAGGAAGLIAGGLGASAAIGTAGDAIAKLPVSEAVRHQLTTSSAVAFSVTYLVGLFTSIVTIGKIGPWLMRVDLKSACRELEVELGMDKDEPGVVSAYQHFVARSYSIPESFDGRTAEALERAFSPARVFVERVANSHGPADAYAETVLHRGQRVALTGRGEVLASANNPLGACEVDDPELLDIPVVTVEHVLTRRDLGHRTLAEVAETLEREVPTRGVFVREVSRGGAVLPLGAKVVLERGDTLRLVGVKRHVERVAARLGSVAWPSAVTDMAALGLAIAIGGLIGLPALRFAGVDIGLSAPVGILAGGLVAGWIHSRRPLFGRLPEAASSALSSLGLSAFLAVVGIGAGPLFIVGLRTAGIPLLVAGVLVAAIPNIVTALVGRYLLGLHPAIVLGICAGAGTSQSGLAAVQEAADSRVPTLGYGVSYAIGNILLALCGSLIVAWVGAPLH